MARLGPLLAALQYVTYTSGFVYDITLSYCGANGPTLSTTLCLEVVRQVAVPAERQTTTVFGRVHQNVARRWRSLLSTINLFLSARRPAAGGIHGRAAQLSMK